MVYAPTSYNRIVCAAPPNGGLAYEKPQSGYAICAVFRRHILSAAETATQFLYRSRKKTLHTTAMSYVMCPKIFYGITLFGITRIPAVKYCQ
jgi:hypothetical protein